MRGAQFFDRVINWPSPTGLAAAVAGGAALLLMAGWLLAVGKWPWRARGLVGVGLLMILAALFAVDVQTVRRVESESVISTRPRYPERARITARGAMVAVPGVVAVVVLSVWAAMKGRLRSQVPRHIKAGRRHCFQTEYDAAIAEFSRAIEIAPYAAEAYYGRGCAYHALGHTGAALADLDRAIQCDPRLALAYIERAKICTENGELDAALADFGQLMTIRPNDPELYLNRGICLVKKGLVADAVSDFHRVLKLTNHSDFAEPAKNYLCQFEAPTQPPPPAASSNGAPASSASSPQPKAEDYVL